MGHRGARAVRVDDEDLLPQGEGIVARLRRHQPSFVQGARGEEKNKTHAPTFAQSLFYAFSLLFAVPLFLSRCMRFCCCAGVEVFFFFFVFSCLLFLLASGPMTHLAKSYVGGWAKRIVAQDFPALFVFVVAPHVFISWWPAHKNGLVKNSLKFPPRYEKMFSMSGNRYKESNSVPGLCMG